jgi:diacylglycerol kinase family enzyme
MAYTGAHVKRPFVEVTRGRVFRFESERSMAVYADGEPLTSTPVEFSIAEERLRIMVPRGGSV